MYNILTQIGLMEINEIYRPPGRHHTHKGLKYKLKLMKDLYTLYICNSANNVRNKEFSMEV